MTSNSTPKPKRRLLPIILGAVVLCVLLAFVGALLSPSDPAAPTADSRATVPAIAVRSTNTPRPTATPRPAATSTVAPTLEDHILAAIGRVNRSDAPAPSILIGDQVVIVFPANDGLSAGMIRRDTQRRALAIAQAVRDNTDNGHDLRITASGPLIDAYGNTAEEHVMRISLDRPTLAKINFDGINPDNLPIIADQYWQHPALDD